MQLQVVFVRLLTELSLKDNDRQAVLEAAAITRTESSGLPILPAWCENQFLGGRASCPPYVMSGETPDPRGLKGSGGIWPFAAFIGRPESLIWI